MAFKSFLLSIQVLNRPAILSHGESVNQRIVKEKVGVFHDLLQGLIVLTGIQNLEIALEGRMSNFLMKHPMLRYNDFI